LRRGPRDSGGAANAPVAGSAYADASAAADRSRARRDRLSPRLSDAGAARAPRRDTNEDDDDDDDDAPEKNIIVGAGTTTDIVR
jgi:hypothetical protein